MQVLAMSMLRMFSRLEWYGNNVPLKSLTAPVRCAMSHIHCSSKRCWTTVWRPGWTRPTKSSNLSGTKGTPHMTSSPTYFVCARVLRWPSLLSWSTSRYGMVWVEGWCECIVCAGDRTDTHEDSGGVGIFAAAVWFTGKTVPQSRTTREHLTIFHFLFQGQWVEAERISFRDLMNGCGQTK